MGIVKEPCLTPTCPGDPVCRGLCRTCYNAAGYLVRKGKTTWDKLVGLGRALKASGKGRKGSWVQDHLLKE